MVHSRQDMFLIALSCIAVGEISARLIAIASAKVECMSNIEPNLTFSSVTNLLSLYYI